ncbi:polysaccharide biosynthesis/export family protein [Amylibacter sp.]|nr:polysaccharide biosynthesis/export family protein [Amylibacter sp.]
MTRFIILICSIASALFLNGCSQILETVTLSSDALSDKAISVQEDFKINIKSLTFKNATKANNDPYPRRLMLTGIGNKANVFDEADFLSFNIPTSSPPSDYLLGHKDTLSYMQLNEFAKLTIKFPPKKIESDYLIGVGDQLTLIQLSDAVGGLSAISSNEAIADNASGIINNRAPQNSELILETSGIVGTEGNILLLGLGSIKAENRSLNEIQTEVRNILIRNGLAPNFQLEITGFNSKKAFITFSGTTNRLGENVIALTNLTTTLKEVALKFGLQPLIHENIIIKLIRNGQTYRMTAGQVLDKSSDRIIVEDRDQIKIYQNSEIVTKHNVAVNSDGNILLPIIGSIKAENRSLAEVRSDISQILSEQGMITNFQLEITGFKSKKFFLVSKGYSSSVIALDDTEISLKEAILKSNFEAKNQDNFIIVNLVRDGKSYQMTYKKMLNNIGEKILIKNGDTIELKNFDYKLGEVFVLTGAGKANIVKINPSKRETLADILFTTSGALNNLSAKRSEIYLLRGQNPSVAYHLDAQNVSRVLVAAKTELRPNDIVYVAERPIISFSRTLREISPLRILLRDIKNDDIP